MPGTTLPICDNRNLNLSFFQATHLAILCHQQPAILYTERNFALGLHCHKQSHIFFSNVAPTTGDPSEAQES